MGLQPNELWVQPRALDGIDVPAARDRLQRQLSLQQYEPDFRSRKHLYSELVAHQRVPGELYPAISDDSPGSPAAQQHQQPAGVSAADGGFPDPRRRRLPIP